MATLTEDTHDDEHSRDAARFFSLSHDLFAVSAVDGTLRQVNPAWCRTHGQEAGDVVGRPFLDFVHEDDRELAARGFAEMVSGRPSEPLVLRSRTPSGDVVLVEWFAQLDTNRGLVHAVGRNVTAVRRAAAHREALGQAWLSVSAGRSLDDMLQAATDSARTLTACEQAAISLAADGGYQEVSAVSLGDVYASWRAYDEPPDGSGIYEEVCRTNAPMRLTQEELEAHPRWRAFGSAAGSHPPLRGWLAVPLVGGSGQNLGLIQLSDKADGTEFSADDEALMVEFSRLVALVVERAYAQERAAATLAGRNELLESISDAFLSVDGDRHCRYVNAAAGRLFGRPAEAMLGRPLDEVVPPSFGTSLTAELAVVAQEGSPRGFEHRDAHARHFDVRVYPAESGATIYITDNTDRTRATAELASRAVQQQRVAELGRAALSGRSTDEMLVLALDTVTSVLDVNSAAVFEVTAHEDEVVVTSLAVGATATGVPPRLAMDRAVYETTTVGRALERRRPVVIDDYATYPGAHSTRMARQLDVGSGVAVPLGDDGAFRGVLFVGDASTARFDDQAVVFVQQVAHVVAAAVTRQRFEERVLHQATHDTLTGLPNRMLLKERVESVLSASTPACHPALLLLDLDGFKDVNDSMGHAVGDRLLEQLAQRLLQVAGAGDTVARLGGDEFALCRPLSYSRDELGRLAAVLLSALRAPYDLGGLEVTLSASIGIAVAPVDGTDASTLLRHADVAMYRAKGGRSGWEFFDRAVDEPRAERLTHIAELRAAISAGELALHYQPVVELVTGEVCAVEALVRWQHPRRGLVPPADFIPLAEQTGLILALTEWVIERAAADARGWASAGRPLRCAVNLSPVALQSPESTAALVARFARHHDVLAVEMTESALASQNARSALHQLSGAGLDCAIDDFGTGYSSLAAVKTLPVSTLKIDRAFVRDVASSDVDAAIIRSVVDLAGALSRLVVAEGVESREAAERLVEAGVRRAQGYHFTPPLPEPALRAWLSARAAGA